MNRTNFWQVLSLVVLMAAGSAQIIAATDSIGTAPAVKSFTVIAKKFSFSPDQITVRKGDKVKITIQNQGGFHNLVVDGYGVKTDFTSGGNFATPGPSFATVEFTADKPGTFPFYCGVDIESENHRAMGMKGSLVVLEN